MTTADESITDRGVLSLPEYAWAQAFLRSQIIAPLADTQLIGHQAADEAAHALGLSRRQIYVLVRCYRQGSSLVTDMARHQSSGGRGAVRENLQFH